MLNFQLELLKKFKAKILFKLRFYIILYVDLIKKLFYPIEHVFVYVK